MPIPEDIKKEIDEMSQYDMAYHWRFDISGESHYFTGEIGEYFRKVFNAKGGMTAEISKKLGWDRP
jgi:hypothetical protein